MKRQNTGFLKAINWWTFAALILYMLFISWRLLFYAYMGNQRYILQEFCYNLVPFKTIIGFLLNTQNISFKVWTYNLAGNIAAFMPLGFLLTSTLKRINNKKSTFSIALTLIIIAEVAQLVTRRGVFDIDDIILNMVGVGIGYYIYKIMKKKR